jgi:hypothetical protein
MILKNLIEKENAAQVSHLQIAIAKGVLNYLAIKDPDTQEEVLDSYRGIVERADDQEEIRQRAYDSQGDDNSLDLILDDPRRGQAVFINNGDY